MTDETLPYCDTCGKPDNYVHVNECICACHAAAAVAFKENVVKVAHEWATKNNYCGAVESAMDLVGLQVPRQEYKDSYKTSPIVGEVTMAEFDTWKWLSAKKLYDRSEGYSEKADDVIQQAGFPSRDEIAERTRRVDIKIEGRFAFTLTAVVVLDGFHPRNFVTDSDVRRAFNYAVADKEQVQWKAKIVEPSSE